MEILREGSRRSSGWHYFAKETPSKVAFDGKNNVEIVIENVQQFDDNIFYNYKVILTPDDVGKIVSEFLKKALK